VFTGTNAETLEMPLRGRAVLEVRMQTKVSRMDEVIVVGYGTIKKSDLTGSITSLRPDDINQVGVASVDQAMIGRAAGVQINQASSEPGGGLTIRIRGASSINAGNEPLYVIDGLPIDNGNMIGLGGV